MNRISHCFAGPSLRREFVERSSGSPAQNVRKLLARCDAFANERCAQNACRRDRMAFLHPPRWRSSCRSEFALAFRGVCVRVWHVVIHFKTPAAGCPRWYLTVPWGTGDGIRRRSCGESGINETMKRVLIRHKKPNSLILPAHAF